MLPPAVTAGVVTSLMVVAPAPSAEVARWNLVADALATEAPILDMVAENVWEVPAVAVVGVILPAVRSGIVGVVTVTVTESSASCDGVPAL